MMAAQGDCPLNFFQCVLLSCIVTLAPIGKTWAQEATPPPVAQNVNANPNIMFDIASIESLEPAADDLKSRAALQHEFRLEVAAGRSECFHQRLEASTQLYVSFKVLKGLDLDIGFLIKGPGDLILENQPLATDSNIQHQIQNEGIYHFCFNNQLGQFSSKLVHFFILIYLPDEWQQHSKNVLEFFGEADSILKSLSQVDGRMQQILVQQANSRLGIIADWYLIQGNHSYVQTMSFILCFIIGATSAFQVYFVRRLFSTKNVKTSKPRA